jgi:P27 family predicted phage terminase small subunit
MAGKRKKTPEIEKAQGYPGKRKGKTEAELAALQPVIEVEHDGETVTGLPHVPPWLSEKGRAIWRELGADLARLRILKVSDLHAFARYCDYLGHWQDLRGDLTTRGGKLRTTYTMTTAAGSRYRARDPRFTALLQLDKVLKDSENAFGLNPNARTSLLLRIANIGPYRPTGTDSSADTGARAEMKKPGSPIGWLNRSRDEPKPN